MFLKKTLFFLMLSSTVCFSALAQDWQTNLGKAEELAAAQDKPIILVFQGSDWCAPCIKLNREIWSTETFKNYSKDHFVMLKADFPRSGKNALEAEQQEENNKLAALYNPEGYFPLVVVLDQKGNVLGKTGYKHLAPEEYIKTLNAFQH